MRILFLTSSKFLMQGKSAYFLKLLFLELEKLNSRKVQLFIRSHPFQNIINLNALSNFSKINCKFVNNMDLKSAIYSANIIIYENTTAGFDAMLSGKPTIYFNPYLSKDTFTAAKNNASLAILSAGDIEKKLIKFIDNKQKWKKYSKNGKRYAQKYLGLDKNISNVKIITNLIG